MRMSHHRILTRPITTAVAANLELFGQRRTGTVKRIAGRYE
jgi:hypothetical protein